MASLGSSYILVHNYSLCQLLGAPQDLQLFNTIYLSYFPPSFLLFSLPSFVVTCPSVFSLRLLDCELNEDKNLVYIALHFINARQKVYTSVIQYTDIIWF